MRVCWPLQPSRNRDVHFILFECLIWKAYSKKKNTRIVTYNNKRCISLRASLMRQLAWLDLATLEPVLHLYVTRSTCQQ